MQYKELRQIMSQIVLEATSKVKQNSLSVAKAKQYIDTTN